MTLNNEVKMILRHILVNIIKANKTLQEKIDTNAAGTIIEDWTTMLQYYIAALVDNNIPGVHSVAQRSGRPLKTIRERLNGKGGRVRETCKESVLTLVLVL